MPVKIKTVAKPAPAPEVVAPAETPVDPAVAEKVVRYGDLLAQIEKLKKKLDPLLKEQAELKASFNALIESVPADEKAVLFAADGSRIELGPKANQVIAINKQAVIEKLGLDQFVELAVLPVGDLRKAFSEKEFAEVAAEDRVGYRTVKYVPA